MQTIYLDISNKGVIPCIQAKQSEVGRKFLAVITDNGVPYNIPDNSLLSVWYEGDTDAGNYSSIEEKSAFSIDGNKISVELVAQMLLKPGNGELCLSITHGDGGEINTWNIPYNVEYKPGAGSAVPTEYYTALTDAASRAAEQVGLAAQKAKDAEFNADKAAESAYIAEQYGKSFLLTVYPVGSIYISLSPTSPSELFGGDWERLINRFLLGSSSSVPMGSFGGSETHTLTVDELPPHTHGVNGLRVTAEKKDTAKGEDYGYVEEQSELTGGGEPFSIMPPYISVNMWRRIA